MCVCGVYVCMVCVCVYVCVALVTVFSYGPSTGSLSEAAPHIVSTITKQGG